MLDLGWQNFTITYTDKFTIKDKSTYINLNTVI